MSDSPAPPPADPFAAFLAPFQQGTAAGDVGAWQASAQQLGTLWTDFQREQAMKGAAALPAVFDPAGWMTIAQGWVKQHPFADPARQTELWEQSLALWQGVLGQFGIGGSPVAGTNAAPSTALPARYASSAASSFRYNSVLPCLIL